MSTDTSMTSQYQMRFPIDVESVPVALVVADATGTLIEVNAATEQLMGHLRTELIGARIQSLIPQWQQPDPAGAQTARESASLSRPIGQGKLLYAKRKGGSEFLIEVGFNAIDTDAGQCLICSFVDVTERTHVRLELTESQETDKTLFEAIRDGVGVIQDHHFVIANRTLAAMVEYSQEEISKVKFTDMIAPEFAPLLAARYENRMKGGTEPPAKSEVRVLKKDGSLGPWVEINANRISLHQRPASLVVLRDITERKATAEKLEMLATEDALTGLANRRGFLFRLDQALLAARRHHSKVGVFYLDLDRFKPVNDRYGHATGDSVLQQIAGRLVACVRSTDTVARLGGDEFGVILAELNSAESASLIAEKILHDVAQPMDAGNVFVEVGVSIGIAIYPEQGEDGELLLHRADEALYRVKHEGKNSYAHWS